MTTTKVVCANCLKEFGIEVWQLHTAAPVHCPHCGHSVDKAVAQNNTPDKRHTT